MSTGGVSSGISGRIRRQVMGLAEEHAAVGEVLRGANNACLSARYCSLAPFFRTNKKMVVFCSFEGRSYSDSPRALFEYMVRCGAFTDYTLIWGFCGDLKKYRRILSERVRFLTANLPQAAAGAGESGAGHRVPRICLVRYDSADWRKCLSASGCWILNYKVKDYLKPRADQVFVQTWHGTPLKRLGYDITHFDNPTNTAQGLARHYGIEAKKFTYFLSSSPYATEKFRSAWRMDEFGKHDIMLEEGYPRNDVLVNHAPDEAKRIRARILGARADEKKVILYAPTYRQEQHVTAQGYTWALPLDLRKLQADLGEDYVFLFRAHYLITNQIDFDAYRGFAFDVSGEEDINDLYLISDLLVTDYSSAMFDFALLRRPMIFHMYDLEYYRDQSNGFYFDPEKVLPGPIVRDQAALTAAVREAASSFTIDETYEKFIKTFDPYEDGHASERVIRRVFAESF